MGKKIIGYFGSWSIYRPGAGKFEIAYIDPDIFTHVIYTFVGLNGDEIKVLDPWADLPDNGGKAGFKHFNALKSKNRNLKTLIAIGGWNEGSEKYSVMASNPNSRSRFTKNAIAFVKKHGFDGFDLDWEYPSQRGGSPSDVTNFIALVKEMREAFDKEGLILSAAVAAAETSASQSYNISEISKYLHFINLMTYDFHGSWDNRLGLNAPLFPASSDVESNKRLTVDAAVKYWLSQGASAEKLILGIATYGRSFTLLNPTQNQIGESVQGPGLPGPYTREAGMLGYNEIYEMQQNDQWTVVYDNERKAPYAYHGNQWVGYDNVQSVKEKAHYIEQFALGGAMVWSIENDDFRGKCGEKYPLIKTLKRSLL